MVQMTRKLSPEKQALLLQKLREKNKLNQIDMRQPRKPGINTFPLSFAQERLWILDQLAPGNPAYNIFNGVRLRGALRVDALEYGFQQIVQRHESLRTTFHAVDGIPQQVIAPSLDVTLSLADLSMLPSEEKEDTARQLAREEAQQPFDLSTSPLVRCRLLKLDAEEHILLFTMHHIISDGWSMNIVFREIVLISQAYAAGQETVLAHLPIQYADFSVWQRERLQGEVLESQMNYWKEQLKGAPAAFDLSISRARPAVQTNRGSMHTFECSPALTQALRILSQQKGVTLFATLLTAFQILLSRYSGETDIVVGSPHANRNRRELEELIGFFVNTLVLRADLSGNPSFGEALQRVHEVTMGAHGHQDLPFEKLVDGLHVARDPSRSPLFQIMFTFLNTPETTVELLGLTLEPYASDRISTQFDLTLLMAETKHGLVGSVQYNPDLFESEAISRMFEHFRVLLEGIVANPGAGIQDLPILGADERHQLLIEWNATETGYPRDKCIHELFEAQVQKTPEAVAVVFGDRQLTYRELNRRANQLAHYLQKQGVGPNVLVGICVERSLEMIVGLLGILKAGGAYVPLDPAYPQERLAFMLANTGLSVVVTQARLHKRLPENIPHVVCVDTDWPVIERESEKNLTSGLMPDHLLYVIYTSGSTGHPKGSGVYQRGFVNLLHWFINQFELGNNDRVLLISSLSFDLTQKNLYAPLLVGGQLHLQDSEPYDAGEIVRTVCKNGITWLNCTPSAFYPLVDYGDQSLRMKRTLRYVFLGGEPISLTRLSDWLKAVGGATQLVNTYGPTECTDISTSYRASGTGPGVESEMPIGKPISNVRVYVLDQNLSLVPVGVTGELCVAGDGVGPGYINNLDLTLAKFVPDPFSRQPGARLYRTGDLARWLPDGNLDYLGRIDNQVKVRGFRIELGEIEAILSQQSDVQQAIVVVREDRPGDSLAGKRLVAYLVLRPESQPSVSALRSALKARLPDYMLPSAFVFLDQLPLSPNGKIDRKALPAPDGVRPASEKTFVAPRTPLEEQLATIWADVLDINPSTRVGIHDNFFEMGGDSLLSLRVVARAQRLGLALTPRQMQEYQTLAELAEILDSTPKVSSEQGLVTGPLPLSAGQSGLLSRIADTHCDLDTIVPWEVPHPVNPGYWEQAVQAIFAHHDALRASFQRKPDGWHQSILAPEVMPSPFNYINLASLPEAEQRSEAVKIASQHGRGVSLAQGPLFRAILFDFGPQSSSYLLFLVSHLVIDRTSFAILLDDLQLAYEQLSRGETVQLPPKTTSFKEWTERLQAYVCSDEQLREREYWLTRPWDKVPHLPHDKIAQPLPHRAYQVVTTSFSQADTDALLLALPQKYNAPLANILLTACVQTITQWTKGEWLALEVIGSGRDIIPHAEDVDVSRTVGWFATGATLVLERDNSGDLIQALDSVQKQLEQIPNRGYGFQLQERLSNDAGFIEKLRASHKPEFSFNYMSRDIRSGTAMPWIASAIEEAANPMDELASYSPLVRCLGHITNGQLQLEWFYNTQIHRASTIKKLAREVEEILRDFIRNN